MIMDLMECALDLYNATKHCKEGNCNNCPRYESWGGGSNYICRKTLLKDCFEFFDQYTEED